MALIIGGINMFGRKKNLVIKYCKNESLMYPVDIKGDWVDLRACEGVEVYNYHDDCFAPLDTFYDDVAGNKYVLIEQGDLIKVPLGVCIELPNGFEAHVKPRSSLSKTTGLLNATSGIIDEGYCGDKDEWFVCFYATRNATLYLGERVAQFRIFKKQPKLNVIKVDKLSNKNRGGHGSSGRF
jgi:dUTPase